VVSSLFSLKLKGKKPDFKFLKEIIPASISFSFTSGNHATVVVG